MNETTIYLIPEEAAKFLIFQQYYKPVSKMIQSKVFEQKNATISLYFDHEGELQTIIRNDFLYKNIKKDWDLHLHF